VEGDDRRVTREAELVASTDVPRTTESLARDLRALGLGGGDVVLVHSSLSALGWVSGGVQAAAQALLDAVTPGGTVVVPTQSGGLSDPAEWRNPPVPEAWVDAVRDSMPAYDPDRTPTRGMGAIAELLRTWPGAIRSAHPNVSFAAIGPAAERIVASHELANSLGENSPLARLYDLDAFVLLLGVDHSSNTSLHLAEYRSGRGQAVQLCAPVTIGGRREWRTWDDIDLDSSVFASLGEDFERKGAVTRGTVGSADARLMRLRAAVDFGVEWLREHAP
jgi:aminoglycoside 3-N-acetyltransferase